MKAQQGIGTILILIAIVLASVIAAFLLIQTADQLRTKALTLQREHERLLMDRVIVKEVDGVTGDCNGEQCVRYIIIRAMLAPGSNPLDLTKALFSFITSDIAMQGIRYVPPEDLYTYDENDTNLIIIHNVIIGDTNYSSYPACRASLLHIMDSLGVYDISKIAEALDPFLGTNDPRTGSIFTALWTDCYDKGDTRSLLKDQEIMIFYRPKRPLYPSEEFSIEIGSPQGYSESKDLMVPRGFEGKVVKIFP